METNRRNISDQDPYYSDLKHMVVYLRSELNRYKQTLRRVHENIRYRQLDSLLEENENLLLKVEDLNKRLKIARNQLNSEPANKNNTPVRVTMDDSHFIARLNKKEEEKEQLKGEMRVMEEKMDELNEKLKQSEAKIKGYQNLESRLTKQIIDLKDEQDALEKQFEEKKKEYEEELRSYKQGNEKLYARLYEMESRLEEAKRELHQKSEQNDEEESSSSSLSNNLPEN